MKTADRDQGYRKSQIFFWVSIIERKSGCRSAGISGWKTNIPDSSRVVSILVGLSAPGSFTRLGGFVLLVFFEVEQEDAFPIACSPLVAELVSN